MKPSPEKSIVQSVQNSGGVVYANTAGIADIKLEKKDGYAADLRENLSAKVYFPDDMFSDKIKEVHFETYRKSGINFVDINIVTPGADSQNETKRVYTLPLASLKLEDKATASFKGLLTMIYGVDYLFGDIDSQVKKDIKLDSFVDFIKTNTDWKNS